MKWLEINLLFFGLLAALAFVANCQENGKALEEQPGDASLLDDDAPDMKIQYSLNSAQIRSLHTKIDANKDGSISIPEIMDFTLVMQRLITKRQVETEEIPAMDEDKDGKVSFVELVKFQEREPGKDREDDEEDEEEENQKQRELAFYAADRDRDGLLNAEELPSLFFPEFDDSVLELTAAATMKAQDANSDGFLTKDEFPEDNPDADGDGQDIFAKLDVDGSGSVSLEELKALEAIAFRVRPHMEKLFRLIKRAAKDSNMVTADELDEARERIVGTDGYEYLMQWAEHHDEL